MACYCTNGLIAIRGNGNIIARTIGRSVLRAGHDSHCFVMVIGAPKRISNIHYWDFLKAGVKL